MKLLCLIFSLTGLKVAAEDAAPAKLPEGTATVVLVLYDYLVDPEHPRIETNGKMHPGLMSDYTKILNKPQTEKLLQALTQNHERKEALVCDFAPHHGVLFKDSGGKVLGSVSICFFCKQLRSDTFPVIGNEFFPRWGWPGLKSVFKDSGIPILDSNEEYTALRKPKKANKARHSNPH